MIQKDIQKPDLNKLSILEANIGYHFKDKNILIQALTHKSYVNEFLHDNYANNERLEFLGDAVLQFVISDLLMEQYPLFDEGNLSKFRAALVSEKGLFRIATKLELGNYILLGRGEEQTGGRKKKSILSDAVEALIAAIYRDSKPQHELKKAYQLIKDFFKKETIEAAKTFLTTDYKSELQEFVQKYKLERMSYELISETGPDHLRTFTYTVKIKNKVYGKGQGKNKKTAEQNAAIETLIMLRKIHENH